MDKFGSVVNIVYMKASFLTLFENYNGYNGG